MGNANKSVVILFMVFFSTAAAPLFAQGPYPCPSCGEAAQCQCTCPDVCTPFVPLQTWYVSAEILALRRDPRQDEFPLVWLGPIMPGSHQVMQTNDFDLLFEGGVRAVVGRTLSERFRLEGAYFGLYKWQDDLVVRDSEANELGGTGVLFSPLSDFGIPDPVPGIDYNFYAAASFVSRLDSAELNLRHSVAMPPGPLLISVLAGVRYFRINEELGYYTQANVPTPQGAVNEVVTSTGNDLVGVQIGALTQLRVEERCWFDFEVKGGLATDRARQMTDYTHVDQQGVTAFYVHRAQRDVTAFFGEASLVLNCQIAQWLNVVAGYRAVFIDGLALATDNFSSDINILTLGPPDLKHEGAVVYHGPSLGVTLTW